MRTADEGEGIEALSGEEIHMDLQDGQDKRKIKKKRFFTQRKQRHRERGKRRREYCCLIWLFQNFLWFTLPQPLPEREGGKKRRTVNGCK